jgi:hypothetical protein
MDEKKIMIEWRGEDEEKNLMRKNEVKKKANSTT